MELLIWRKVKKVLGIEGAKTALIQAEREYEAISRLYPDGKIGRWNEDPRNFYYGWLVDRQNHGLSNTVYQYIGIKLGEYRNDDEFIQLVNQRNAIDQYITKNWKYWDLVKFVMGYERWNVGNYPPATEEVGIYYFIPQTLRAFGFPVSPINNIEPTPLGAAVSEWAISLPDNIYNGLKNHSQILEGSANLFGLYYCKEGLVKDGVKKVYLMLPSSDIVIYLMKKP
ncbi:MAG: hypothetical protein LM587_04070 [Candidatus Aenigmarchaeota archaeon]|nr:hypothetical protein [Candidatus Aenigmarchaeota archaeon]